MVVSNARAERLSRAAYVTVRKGNRKSATSYWAEGGRWILAVLTALICVTFAFLFVWSNHQSVQVGYAVSSLHREQAELSDLNRKYKVEIANLTSLDRLEQAAKTELGLVTPGSHQVQVIE